jgi:serine phosphatase RsbU (regulator of sigma subunit)
MTTAAAGSAALKIHDDVIPDTIEALLAPTGALAGAFPRAAMETGSVACIVNNVINPDDAELRRLRQEVQLLRRRDETLKFYMQRLDEELRLAARLQQDFLPKSLPHVGRVHFHKLYRPAGYVSGDLYDVTRLDESHVGFYIADAVGHGMPAALLTMFLKTALVMKEIKQGGYRLLTPSETISRLNESLCDQGLTQATFATALYGHVNTHTLEVTIARGGHPSPVLLRANGHVESIDADGGLLGIFPGETFEQATAQLEPGDRLFVFTDGIEVAFSGPEQTIDTERWRAELHARRHLPTAELLEDFARHIDQEAGSITPKDDLTMIVLEVK